MWGLDYKGSKFLLNGISDFGFEVMDVCGFSLRHQWKRRQSLIAAPTHHVGVGCMLFHEDFELQNSEFREIGGVHRTVWGFGNDEAANLRLSVH
jgi:hypothetical protein